MPSFANDYHRSFDTYNAVDAGDSLAAELTMTQRKNLPVLERQDYKDENDKTCNNLTELKCPPSLVNHMRNHHLVVVPTPAVSTRNGRTTSRYRRPVDSMAINGGGDEESGISRACVEKNFHLSSSAQSIVQSIANPCSPAAFRTVLSDGEDDVDNDNDDDGDNSLVKPTTSPSRGRRRRRSKQRQRHHPLSSMGTPPTSGSSRDSDDDKEEEDESYHEKDKDATYLVVRSSTIKQGKDKSRRKKETNRAVTADLASLPHSVPLPNGRDVYVLVGDELYHLVNTPTGCIANRLKNPSACPRDNKLILDLTCHSYLEWTIVLEFLKPSPEVRERIGWSKLPLLLPWFVEVRSLPLASEADMFLLHNVLGGRSDGAARPISVANLLKLSRIAYACGLETTKNQVRRFLRHGLLHPRKTTSSHSTHLSEQDEFELDWELEDLKDLAELMAIFDECRDYLWEYAVISYLPHDLDIADSWGLVSNPLFPYLLREGMMQMMILESMESSSFISEQASLNHKKSNKSYSDITTSSDITIPTSPAKSLSQKEIERNLLRIIRHLEKYQDEKEMKLSKSISEDDSSIAAQENLACSTTTTSRQRRSQRNQAILSPPILSQERFAC